MEETAIHKTGTEELRNLIALTLIPNLGVRRIRTLVHHFGGAGPVMSGNQTRLMKVPDIGGQIAREIASFRNWKQVDALMERTLKVNGEIITLYDSTYPERLRQLYDAPVLLWCLGNISLLDTKGIAVVGTRRPTAYGRAMAESFTRDLVHQGITVISGLAYGVDTIAHAACLKAGGKTIAVLGSGIDRIYPASNKKLARDMVDKGGLVISEFPPGTRPDAPNFPARNRIVSGLSLGVLVIETGEKGGSMITARMALDQNREVFVLPHSLENPAGSGGNILIQKGGGKLVRNIEDVMIEFPLLYTGEQDSGQKPKQLVWRDMGLSGRKEAICKLLEEGERHIDQISEYLEEPSNALMNDLLELEMMDCIRQTAGKHFQLR